MKAVNNYTLSVSAQSDIFNIARFTIEKFGVNQSLKYAEGLKGILSDLASNPNLGRPYLAAKSNMIFRYRFKAHMIFYYPNASGIFIVRVLGAKMHFPKHL